MAAKTIAVYGTGCKKCETLHKNVVEAVAQVGGDIEVQYVKDIVAISAAGVMSTPAVGIDGKIVSSGKVLDVKAVVTLLS